MTARPRTVLLTLIGPPLCGVLVACLVVAAWVATGLPLAKGETWFTIQKVAPAAGASYTSGQPDQLQFFLVVGNDSRDPNGVGLGDAIHVIAVNPGRRRPRSSTSLAIPRSVAAARSTRSSPRVG